MFRFLQPTLPKFLFTMFVLTLICIGSLPVMYCQSVATDSPTSEVRRCRAC